MFVFVSCKKDVIPPVIEIPFSFIESWDYSQKIYRFADTPFIQVSNGLECNGKTNFTFRTDEFEITIAVGGCLRRKILLWFSLRFSRIK